MQESTGKCFFHNKSSFGKRHRGDGAFCFALKDMDDKQIADTIDMIDEQLEDLRASLDELEADWTALKAVIRGAGIY